MQSRKITKICVNLLKRNSYKRIKIGKYIFLLGYYSRYTKSGIDEKQQKYVLIY